MPSQDLIDVRVIVGGRSLKEYREPGTVDEDHTQVRYIEITAGQQFGVQITWQAGFDFMWADGLYYKFEIDNDDSPAYSFTPKRDTAHYYGRLVKAEVETRDTDPFKNETTGQWEHCPYVFGALGIGELCDQENDHS